MPCRHFRPEGFSIASSHEVARKPLSLLFTGDPLHFAPPRPTTPQHHLVLSTEFKAESIQFTPVKCEHFVQTWFQNRRMREKRLKKRLQTQQRNRPELLPVVSPTNACGLYGSPAIDMRSMQDLLQKIQTQRPPSTTRTSK